MLWIDSLGQHRTADDVHANERTGFNTGCTRAPHGSTPNFFVIL
jgi:hypothetical protein